MSRQDVEDVQELQGYNDAEHDLIEQADSPGAEAQLKTQNSKLKTILARPHLTLVSRLVLGGIFLLSGLTKLGIPGQFAESIDSYEMPLPQTVVDLMANWLPPLELGLGIWLIIGLFTRFSAAVSGGLMLVFLIALAQAAFRGLSPNCGCFAGPQESNALGSMVVEALGPLGTFLTNEKIGPGIIIRDVIFLLMAVHLVMVPTVFALDNLRARGNRAGAMEEAE